MGARVGGRFTSDGDVPPCPFDGHRGSRVQSYGSRTRKDGVEVRRYACFHNGSRHTFSECFAEDPPPVFAPAKCPQGHRGKVTRKGTNNSNGAKHQRYKCTPSDGNATHTFTMELPRQRVERDPNWTDADSVRNPHRGPVASGRGHGFTMRVVAEGLQRLSQGESYASVGEWAAGQKAARERKVEPAKRSGKHYWQTGASWVEVYAPVVWDAWQEELVAQDAAAARSSLPRVLVIDDVPVFGDVTEEGVTSATMLFSVLAAVEYFPSRTSPDQYDHRVRLVRAYPQHTADAYELLVYECGFIPDVIVADSAHGIVKMIKRLRAYNPDLVWVPSAWHVVNQLRRAMNKLTAAKLATPFVPGDLLARMESMAFLADETAWATWWADLDRRMNAQAVPANLRPNKWRKAYDSEVRDALRYLAAHPQVPRGNGALEASIRNEVTPFFAGRAQRFGNIERVNRACDLLTLRLNGKLARPADIEKVLTAAALAGDGWMPPARQVNDPEGFASLRSKDILDQTLAAARAEARKRWGKR
jgi:hypothetical protein